MRSRIKNRVLKQVYLEEEDLGMKLWAGADSNRRHPDFQSGALPTELPAQL